MKKQIFNFYVQHEQNDRRTKLLNLLLPLVLVLVLGIVYWFVIDMGRDDDQSWQTVAQSAYGWKVLGWFAVIFVVWWLLVISYTSSILKSPIKSVMDASSATHVTPDMISMDPKVKMFSDVVGELALAYGMQSPELYIVESTMEPNAFATGSPDHAGVAITRPLLNMLNRNELSGVLGHELAHVKANDSKTVMTFVSFVSGVSILVVLAWAIIKLGWVLVSSVNGKVRMTSVVGAGLAMTGLVLVVAGYVGKLCVTLLRFAMSRTREYDADATSANVNQDASGLISALTKIDNWVGQQESWQRSAALSDKYSNLYFVSNKTHLLDDHPSTKSRVERLKEMSIG